MGARMTAHAAAGLAAAALGLVLAGPAAAHVEVSADNPQAGARGVTLTFVGAAESDTAGIVSERVVLPEGMTADEVSLVEAPQGWELTADADPEGFTVAGPALPLGQDATFAVMVAQLPADATRLAFRTVETYSDGTVSRWIEIPQEGAAEPQFPAPVLIVAGAATPSAEPATPSPGPTGQTPSAPPTTAQAAPPVAEDRSLWPVWAAGAAALAVALAAGAAFIIWRRRGRGDVSP